MNSTNIPILLCVYRRADKVTSLINALRRIKPKEIYISANAPKDNTEKIYTDKIKKSIQEIDWKCNIYKKYEQTHINDCSLSITKGINWFFNFVEYGIILEDDCIISPSFYDLCAFLLPYYKSNNAILHISGTNLNYNHKQPPKLLLSNFSLPSWGWATWKRAWNNYSPKMDNWVNIKDVISSKVKDYTFWEDLLKLNAEKKIAWDVQWNIDIWRNNGKIIVPSYNLISNVGFDKLATLTTNEKNIGANLPIKEFESPSKFELCNSDNEEYEALIKSFILNISSIKKYNLN